MAAADVAWCEERQATDMIHVVMTKENVGIDSGRGFEQSIPQRAEPRSSIEDHEMAATTDFNASRVAAIASGLHSGTSNAAADSPKANGNIGSQANTRLLKQFGADCLRQMVCWELRPPQ